MAGKDTIVFTGLHETIKGLQEFDKGAVKKFNKVINDELRKAKVETIVLIEEASSHGKGAPLTGWQTGEMKPTVRNLGEKRAFPKWNVGEVTAGIKVSRAQGKARSDYTTSAGALINKSAAGAIFELAGRAKGVSTVSESSASGETFKRVLTNRYGKASRLVWKIVDRDRLKIQANFGRALDEAKATLQKALESQNTH